MARAPGSGIQQSLGIPPGTKFFSPFPFAGMNLQDSPIAIEDSEFLWVENFVRLGKGNLRTNYDAGLPIYTAPTGLTIVMHFFYTIGTTYYAAVFLSDGSALQINTGTLVTKTIGSAGTFYDARNGQLPACAQWGTLYLLISNRNTRNDYWVWDGALLYTSGTAAASGATLLSGGSKYTSTPTVTPFGGNGTGLVVTADVNAGSVVNLTITNPGTGYEVGDVVQLQFSGGGSDTGPILTSNLEAGSVAAVNVTAPGSGYTSATVTFGAAPGGGTTATGTALVGSGVTSVAVTAGGSGYTTGANVAFSGGGGSGAAAVANVNAGVVTSITVTAPGTGYTSAPTVTITGAGTLATATSSIQNNVITGVTITNPGTGYVAAPTVTFGGAGSGATGVAVLNPGSVESVTVVNGGTGLTYAPLMTFVGGGGAGATGIITLTGTSIAKVNVVAGGQDYQSPPTITFTDGGGGTGATAVATISQGQVVAITVTNGGSGYTTNVGVVIQPVAKKIDGTNTYPGTGAAAQAIFAPTSIAGVTISNSGHGYTDAPVVEVSPGANNAAYATVALMPFGLSGSAMETYQQRLWIVNPAPPQFGTLPPGGNFAVTAPGSFTDVATSDGGVLFTNSDGFLQTRYTSVRQSNGYLYFFGDGSVSIVSSVSTSGNPATTTFNYQNVDPQTGRSFRDSGQDFGKTILFANETGVYGIYGGSATLASAKLQDLFTNALFPGTTGAILPSSATATLFDVKHYLMLMTVQDPDTMAYRNAMITWNEKEWTISSQTANLTYISTQKVNSKFTAWGTDGTSLFPLFARPSVTLLKRIDTKLYGGGVPGSMLIKQPSYFWMQAQDRSIGFTGIDCAVDFAISGMAQQPIDPELDSVQSGVISNLLYVEPVFPAPWPAWPVFGTMIHGYPFFSIGARISTSSPDFVIGNFMIGYVDQQALL